MESKNLSGNVLNLLYEELMAFRTELREDNKILQDSLESTNATLCNHTEQLIKLSHTLNGTNGIVSRLSEVELTQKQLAAEVLEIKTKERIRNAVICAICTLGSAIGGAFTWCLSMYLTHMYK